MNREHWKALLPLIEAFANGEDVQQYTESEWVSWGNFAFNAKPENYRIAPKEKTGWINIYSGQSSSYIHPTKEEADFKSVPDRIACIQITYKEGDGL